ncbi:XRN 5'-3' exonuclease N-terminus-domain-containing protein [Catenaria anguillulae PL171]|uniref:XRN 5'-3' exonuclease N-terminus-domain-containing protein n=1 Tax=Catenaria anguillulae PL171 TaxID=765915 RepID=A0A1Y2HR69_9FUNG|nr:XRN 5'-3' exonuclease N-terminus-domain-containing protein [Catenaria anguillulae PL171]
MGIPKFFRWISERYPMCSELITESRIPEFDNLYLDMNGIVHNCSHGNDPTLRLTEEQMFLAIFNYIDHLFHKIKPKKLFYMAIDGVAPRAKMNQQRSRRFRTALEAQMLQQKMLAEGETDGGDNPTDASSATSDDEDDEVKALAKKRFDSNCITPGTPFMKRLSQHLQYFVRKKMTEDPQWQCVRVILSGHEVPGEGEHKIMEYIRHAKAQPDFDPNTRHCLYGLDADLIMLGLVTHEPHFSLLREEVVFGKKNVKAQQAAGLEQQNFFLMHLSIFREYLTHEFAELKVADAMRVEYSTERLIDDFILLSLFVGNDFIPHLPNLHINEGALSLMFDVYKRVMRDAECYMHEHGQIHFPTLIRVLEEMTDVERDAFEQYFGYDEEGNLVEMEEKGFGGGKKRGGGGGRKGPKGKHNKTAGATKKKGNGGGQVTTVATVQDATLAATGKLKMMTESQKAIVEAIKDVVQGKLLTKEVTVTNPINRAFLEQMCFKMNFMLVKSEAPANGNSHGAGSDEAGDGEPETFIVARHEEEDLSDDEVDEPRERHLKKFRKYEVVPDQPDAWDLEAADGGVADAATDYAIEYANWKRYYYTNKLEFDPKNVDQGGPDALQALLGEYLRGLQWVLLYYYNGVASWGWFYPYHYSPHISDLVQVDLSRVSVDFDFGKPFLPFEQLMGVLPAFSRSHLPDPLQELMTDPNSPIIDFYPTEFEQDLNGKKADWEAVVKIPFIDQDRLLKAIQTKEARLSAEERMRNSFGNAHVYTFDPNAPKDLTYPSSMPGKFPPLVGARCKDEVFTLPEVPASGYKRGLCDGVKPMCGFPSLHLVPHVATIGVHGVKVFQMESRNETVVITVTKDQPRAKDVAKRVLGKPIFVDWPFLVEGLVEKVADWEEVYEKGTPKSAKSWASSDNDQLVWAARGRNLVQWRSRRFGVVMDDVSLMVGVRVIKGMERTLDGRTQRLYEDEVIWYPWQLVVESKDVGYVDPRFVEKKALPLAVEFPPNTRVFYLGKAWYGSPAMVAGVSKEGNLELRVIETRLMLDGVPEDQVEDYMTLGHRIHKGNKDDYLPANKVAHRVKLSPFALSRLTSSLHVVMTTVPSRDREPRWNLGLQMKFEGKGYKILGYTRKSMENGWEYSRKAVTLIQSFCDAFPDFVNRLNSNPESGSNSSMYRDVDFFPEAVAKDKLQTIRDWIRASPVAEFSQVPLTADAMDADQIKTLEDKLRCRPPPGPPNMHYLKDVPAEFVMKSEFAPLILIDHKFAIGDRVLCVSDRGKAPLGAHGYVVGVEGEYVEILFDDTFMGGSNLHGRCNDLRGLVVRKNELLNLSKPQGKLKWMKTTIPSPDKLQQLLPQQQQQQYQQPQQQPRPAAAPAEPAWRPPRRTTVSPTRLATANGPAAAESNSLGQVYHIRPQSSPAKPQKLEKRATSSPRTQSKTPTASKPTSALAHGGAAAQQPVIDGAQLLAMLKQQQHAPPAAGATTTAAPTSPTSTSAAMLTSSLKQLLNLNAKPFTPSGLSPTSPSMPKSPTATSAPSAAATGPKSPKLASPTTSAGPPIPLPGPIAAMFPPPPPPVVSGAPTPVPASGAAVPAGHVQYPYAPPAHLLAAYGMQPNPTMTMLQLQMQMHGGMPPTAYNPHLMGMMLPPPGTGPAGISGMPMYTPYAVPGQVPLPLPVTVPVPVPLPVAAAPAATVVSPAPATATPALVSTSDAAAAATDVDDAANGAADAKEATDSPGKKKRHRNKQFLMQSGSLQARPHAKKGGKKGKANGAGGEQQQQGGE